MDADIDGVACGLAYAAFLQAKHTESEYAAGFEGTPHPEARFIAEALGLTIPALAPDQQFEAFILVDASEPHGLPPHVETDKVTEIIDHRMFADFSAFPKARFRIEPIGAAATQIAEFYYFDDSVTLSPEMAALLLCGICSNTVNFKADTTTFRDERMHDWLVSIAGEQYSDLPTKMYDYKSQYALDYLDEVLRLDAKDAIKQFALDEPIVCYQIETNQADALLARENETIDLMQSLYPGRAYQLLLIQDAHEAKTYALSAQTAVRDVLQRTRIPFEATESEYCLVAPHIVMRKSVLQAAKEATKTT